MTPWPADATPRFKPNSPLRTPNEVQAAAHQLVEKHLRVDGTNLPRGIVEIPCGVGKTRIGVQAAFCFGRRALFVVHEAAGVPQLVALLNEHTTLPATAVAPYWTSDRNDAKPKIQKAFKNDDTALYVLTTYQQLHAIASSDPAFFKQVVACAWDLIVLDEAHHLSPLTAEKWSLTAKCLLDGDETCCIHVDRHRRRVLSLTGTVTSTVTRRAAELQLERMYPDGGGPDAAERERRIRSCEAANYKPLLGAVIFSQRWKELGAKGMLATLQLFSVHVETDEVFGAADRCVQTLRDEHASHEKATKPPSERLECPFKGMRERLRHLTPPKLDAILHIVAAHQRLGHMGIVFVEHVQTAEVLQAYLQTHVRNRPVNAAWLIMRGHQSWDLSLQQQEKHPKSIAGLYTTAGGRHSAVQRTNSGASTQPCAGFVCTEVAGSSMDFTAPELRYVILVENSSSQSDHVQRIGRSVRPLRDATGAALPAAEQKTVCVYDLVGDGASEVDAAQRRQAFLRAEGYEYTPLTLEQVRALPDRADGAPLTRCDDEATTARFSPCGLLVRSLAEISTDRRRQELKREAEDTLSDARSAKRAKVAAANTSTSRKKLHQILDQRHGKAVKRAQEEEHTSARYAASRAVMVDTSVLAVLGELLHQHATAASCDDLARAIRHTDSVHLGKQPMKTIKAVLEGQRQGRKERADAAASGAASSSSSSGDGAPTVAPPVA